MYRLLWRVHRWVLCTLIFTAITSVADGQTFDVVPLGGDANWNLPYNDPLSVSLLPDLNDRGEIVAPDPALSGNVSNTIWLPEAAYGLPAGWVNFDSLFQQVRPGAVVLPTTINNVGQVSGLFFDGGGGGGGFVWDSTSSISTFNTRDDFREFGANDMNDGGQVVGFVDFVGATVLDFPVAFRYDGTEAVLPLRRTSCIESTSEATSINTDGWVVGWTQCQTTVTSWEYAGAIWSPTNEITELSVETSNRRGFFPLSINDRRQVVGVWLDESDNVSARMWENGVFRVLENTVEAWALDINEMGMIVGMVDQTPTLWVTEPALGLPVGQFDLRTLISDPSIELLQAVRVNNRGQIVASALVNGQLGGVLLSPQPVGSLVVNAVGDAPDLDPGDGACATGGLVGAEPECTLRAAIMEANAHAGPEEILFDIPGGGIQTINPLGPLPPITETLTIDGYSQPGTSRNSMAGGFDGSIRIELSGVAAGPGGVGLTVASDNVSISGLLINRFESAGIELQGARGRVTGCLVGLDRALAAASPNGVGVRVSGSDNTVGGASVGERNVISGNFGSGVSISGNDNRIEGNLIGIAMDGTTAMGNGEGILVENGRGSFIGGGVAGTGNVISGNSASGVLIRGSSTLGTFVQGNLIGTSTDGQNAVPNLWGIQVSDAPGTVVGGRADGSGNLISGNVSDGILITGPDASGATIRGNTIGLSDPAVDPVKRIPNGRSGVRVEAADQAEVDSNVVAANTSAGIELVGTTETLLTGNRVGTNSGSLAGFGNGAEGVRIRGARTTIVGEFDFLQPNPARQNVILFNGGPGIVIESSDSTSIFSNAIAANEGLGIDRLPEGPNPAEVVRLESVVDDGVTTTVGGRLTGTANHTYRIQLFTNDECDPSGRGEGLRPQATFQYTTDATGAKSFAAVLGFPVGSEIVTATATDEAGETSEFSNCWPAPDLVVTKPLAGELFVAGLADSIRWEARGVDSLHISFAVHPDSAAKDIARGVLASTGLFVWTPAQATLCRRCRIELRDANPGSVEPAHAIGPQFRVKGYIMTRVDATGDYESFAPTKHGWVHGNTKVNWAPSSYSSQSAFRYDAAGKDPFTNSSYPNSWRLPPILAKRDRYPDWPSLVRAFGTDDAYWSTTLNWYKDSAVKKWNTFGLWGGSCSGLSMSAIMAFGDSTRFGMMFPGVGEFERAYNQPITDALRAVIGRVFTFWIGEKAQIHSASTPTSSQAQMINTLILRLKQTLGGEDPLRTSYLYIRNSGSTMLPNGNPRPVWAHAVVPFRMTRTIATNGNTLFNISIYDPNRPGTTRTITVDSTLSTWQYMPTWDGSGSIFEMDPAQNYFPEAVPFGFKREGKSFGPTGIEIAATQWSRVTISDSQGRTAGFADSTVFNSIEGASFDYPPTGFVNPPAAYRLPEGDYSVRLADLPDSTSAVYFTMGGTTYGVGRADAIAGESEDVSLVSGTLQVRNRNARARTVYLDALFNDVDQERFFEIGRLDLAAGDSVSLHGVQTSAIVLGAGSTETSYDLTVRYGRPDSLVQFEHPNVVLEPVVTHTIAPDWSDLSQIVVEVDSDGDGVVDTTIPLENTATASESTVGDAIVPDAFELDANYPNPFNPTTQIGFAAPRQTRVRITVFDALGRQVEILVDEEKPAGRYRVTFDAAGLPSGVYFYRMEAAGFVRTRSLVVLK